MDRHLLPEEIDQLLDGELGFGTSPLKLHLRACATCQAELDAARTVVRQLEQLPYLSPAPVFADRVLGQVQVFVPWHVAMLDTLRGWLPQSRTGRSLAWAGFGGAAVVLTFASLWLLTRLDTAVFAVDMVATRLRQAVTGGLGDLVATLFGEPAVRAMHAGGSIGIWIAFAVLLLSAAFTARAMRAVLAGSRRG